MPKATLSLYFCELVFVLGGSVFARSIAAVVGGESLTAWPALVTVIMAAALSPPTAQAADYWYIVHITLLYRLLGLIVFRGRKWFLVVPNILGVVGCIIISRAQTFGTVIAGFGIGGTSFATQSLFATVVSEVLPRKYRSYGQAANNLAAALGSIFALTVGGRLTRSNPEGFRTYFYIVAGLYAAGSIACAFLYNPEPRELQISLTFRQKIKALDWTAYFLVASGAALVCLGLSWAQNPYPWTNAHVFAPFLIGVVLLFTLIIYSWKLRTAGLLHHKLFQDRNFSITLLSLFIEGTAFFASAVYFPYSLSVMHGETMSPFTQSMCYMVAWPTFGVAAVLGAFYIQKTRTLRIAGVFAFVSFLVFFVLMATVTPSTPEQNFWGYVLFYGVALGVCLVTYVTAAQFSTPPELISITSGTVLSMRNFGAASGLAIYTAIFSHGLSANLVPKITAAVTSLGFPPEEIGTLVEGLTAGNITMLESIPGVSPAIIGAAGTALKEAYAVGFRDVFSCASALVAVAIIGKLSYFFRKPLV